MTKNSKMKPTQAEIDEALGVMQRVLNEIIPGVKYTLTPEIKGNRVAFKFDSESNIALGAWKLLTSVMASMNLGDFGEEEEMSAEKTAFETLPDDYETGDHGRVE